MLLVLLLRNARRVSMKLISDDPHAAREIAGFLKEHFETLATQADKANKKARRNKGHDTTESVVTSFGVTEESTEEGYVQAAQQARFTVEQSHIKTKGQDAQVTLIVQQMGLS